MTNTIMMCLGVVLLAAQSCFNIYLYGREKNRLVYANMCIEHLRWLNSRTKEILTDYPGINADDRIISSGIIARIDEADKTVENWLQGKLVRGGK